jgi:hypothetical protein
MPLPAAIFLTVCGIIFLAGVILIGFSCLAAAFDGTREDGEG